MRVSFFILAFFTSLPIIGTAQQADSLTKKKISTEELANDMKILVELNRSINYTDLSTVEAENLLHAGAYQLIQVTTPYFYSTIPKARHLCQTLLGHAVFQQVSNGPEKQKLVEVLCKNFFDKENFYMFNTVIQALNERDFNDTAKKYVEGLINNVKAYYDGPPAQFLGTAQITKSIPYLWKIIDTNFETMQHRDIDILASLARMNEKKAAALLAEYYNSSFNKFGDSTKPETTFRHFLIAKNLAYSLDSTVLNCLIREFRTIDINYCFHDGDTGFCPARYLGACIVSMIENYPYLKEEALNPKELLDWLATNDIQIKTK